MVLAGMVAVWVGAGCSGTDGGAAQNNPGDASGQPDAGSSSSSSSSSGAGMPDAGSTVIVGVEPVTLTQEGTILDAALDAEEAGYLAVWSQVVEQQWTLYAVHLNTLGAPSREFVVLQQRNLAEGPAPWFSPADLVKGQAPVLLLHEVTAPPSVTVIRLTQDGVPLEAPLHFDGVPDGGAALYTYLGAVRLLVEQDSGSASDALLMDVPVEDSETGAVPLYLQPGHHMVAASAYNTLAVVTRAPDGNLHAMQCAATSRCSGPGPQLTFVDAPDQPPQLQRAGWHNVSLQVLYSQANAANPRRSDLLLATATFSRQPLETQTLATDASWNSTRADMEGDALVWVTSMGGYNDSVRLMPLGAERACDVQPPQAALEVGVSALAVTAWRDVGGSRLGPRVGVLWADARHQPHQSGTTPLETRLYFTTADVDACSGGQ